MLRQAAPAALITTTLALSACGGDSDVDRVRATVGNYYRAVASPRPSDACRLLTAAGKRRLAEATADPSCEDVVGALHDQLYPDEVEALRHVSVSATIFADEHRKAIVTPDHITAPPPITKHYGGRPLVLVNRSGSWLIEDLGS